MHSREFENNIDTMLKLITAKKNLDQKTKHDERKLCRQQKELQKNHERQTQELQIALSTNIQAVSIELVRFQKITQEIKGRAKYFDDETKLAYYSEVAQQLDLDFKAETELLLKLDTMYKELSIAEDSDSESIGSFGKTAEEIVEIQKFLLKLQTVGTLSMAEKLAQEKAPDQIIETDKPTSSKKRKLGEITGSSMTMYPAEKRPKNDEGSTTEGKGPSPRSKKKAI